MLLSVSQVASRTGFPVDRVREAVRETRAGVSRHIDGHWQRRIRPDVDLPKLEGYLYRKYPDGTGMDPLALALMLRLLSLRSAN